mgnify:CR=1 FL=1
MPLSKRRPTSTPARSKTPMLSPRGAIRRKMTRKLFHDSVQMAADIGINPVHLGGRGFGRVDRDTPAHLAWLKIQRKWLAEHAE